MSTPNLLAVELELALPEDNSALRLARDLNRLFDPSRIAPNLVTFVTKTSPFKVRHTLGRVPRGAVLLMPDDLVMVKKHAKLWTADAVWFEGSVAGVSCEAWLL